MLSPLVPRFSATGLCSRKPSEPFHRAVSSCPHKYILAHLILQSTNRRGLHAHLQRSILPATCWRQTILEQWVRARELAADQDPEGGGAAPPVLREAFLAWAVAGSVPRVEVDEARAARASDRLALNSVPCQSDSYSPYADCSHSLG